MNELKAEEVIVKRSMKRANRLEARLDEIEAWMDRLRAVEQEVGTTHSVVSDSAAKVGILHENIVGHEAQAKASISIIGEYQNQISQSAASAKETTAEIEELRDLSNNNRTDITDCLARYSELVADMETLKQETSEAAGERLTTSAETESSLEEKITDATAEFTAPWST